MTLKVLWLTAMYALKKKLVSSWKRGGDRGLVFDLWARSSVPIFVVSILLMVFALNHLVSSLVSCFTSPRLWVGTIFALFWSTTLLITTVIVSTTLNNYLTLSSIPKQLELCRRNWRCFDQTRAVALQGLSGRRTGAVKELVGRFYVDLQVAASRFDELDPWHQHQIPPGIVRSAVVMNWVLLALETVFQRYLGDRPSGQDDKAISCKDALVAWSLTGFFMDSMSMTWSLIKIRTIINLLSRQLFSKIDKLDDILEPPTNMASIIREQGSASAAHQKLHESVLKLHAASQRQWLHGSGDASISELIEEVRRVQAEPTSGLHVEPLLPLVIHGSDNTGDRPTPVNIMKDCTRGQLLVSDAVPVENEEGSCAFDSNEVTGSWGDYGAANDCDVAVERILRIRKEKKKLRVVSDTSELRNELIERLNMETECKLEQEEEALQPVMSTLILQEDDDFQAMLRRQRGMATMFE
eukprot:GHVH01000745.1.p2 GENE.GHVH01000745.1~~GHVH01000745.1.p2  ORF type:complete len:468 (+),score=58.06 GHVH01000745.1:887-2290(+)